MVADKGNVPIDEGIVNSLEPAGLVSCSVVFDISNYEIPVKLICLVTCHQNINILTNDSDVQ